MTIAMIGAGGIGGYFGAKFACAGLDVHFVARGSQLAAMRTNGIMIEGDDEVVRVPNVRVTDEISDLGVSEFVIVAVKLRDTERAIAQIRPLVGPDTTLVSFQNGVTKDEVLEEAFPGQVIGGAAYISSAIDRPGVIKRIGPHQKLVFGELDGSFSARIKRLLHACLTAKIDAAVSTDIKGETWRKFVFLVGVSGTTATMRKTIGSIRADPQTRVFLCDVMNEVVTVARAKGINLPENYADDRLAFIDSLAPDMTSSMHRDLQSGRPLEARWLSGAVVDLGRVAGIATPLNRAIADILALHADGAVASDHAASLGITRGRRAND